MIYDNPKEKMKLASHGNFINIRRKRNIDNI